MPKGRTPEISDLDVIQAAKEINDPCFKTKEISEVLDVSDQTVRNHSEELVESGILGRKQVGSGYIYWIA